MRKVLSGIVVSLGLVVIGGLAAAQAAKAPSPKPDPTSCVGKTPTKQLVICLENKITQLTGDLAALKTSQPDLGSIKIMSNQVGDACLAVNGGGVFATKCTDGVQNRLWHVVPTTQP